MVSDASGDWTWGSIFLDRQTFEQKVREATTRTWPINVGFAAEWFEWTLMRLEAEGAQTATIRHPGKKGAQRETILREVLRDMVPGPISLETGFLVTSLGTVSKEQDIVFVDAERRVDVRPGGDVRYFPIEGCLASIEVKSNLNVADIRAAILNCISAKTLYEQEDGDEPKRRTRYCYGLFAYGAKHSLETTAGQINEAVRNVPQHLRPNIAYVLGKGLLLPSSNDTYQLGPEQMFVEGEFGPIPELYVEPLRRWKRVYPFLVFVSLIVDFCIQMRHEGRAPTHMEYWMRTFNLQAMVQGVPGEK